MGRSDWLRVCGAVFSRPGGVRIGYIARVPIESYATAAAPVTWSLLRWISLTYIVLLNLLRVCYLAVRIVSGVSETMVDIHSAGVVTLGSIPEVIGLTGRRPDAAESRVLQERDVRSVCVLVPDSLGLDQNFQDVTIVDKGDVPESSVSLQELSLLRQQWPPAVLRHMVWLQQDLEAMRTDAKKTISSD